MGRFWMIRAGEGGALAKAFERAGYVGLGWGKAGSFTGIDTLAEMRECLARAYPEEPLHSLRNSAAMAFKYRRAVGIGDRVVTYDGARREYLLGVITGDYEFRPDLSPEYPHVRKVDWDQRVSRDALSSSSRSKLRSMLTLFEPGESVLVDLQDVSAEQFQAKDASDRVPFQSYPVRSHDPARMRSEAIPNHVFVSYSHVDERWLKQLQVHLRPLEHYGKIVVWDDTRMKAGSRWQEEIKDALSRARVAVLLVSPHFLSSEFIHSNELPQLLQAAKHRETLILPLIVRTCRFEQTPALAQFQAFNPPSRPLAAMSTAKRDEVFVALSNRIEEALQTRDEARSKAAIQKGTDTHTARMRKHVTMKSKLGDFAPHAAVTDEHTVNREVAIEGYMVRQLTSGTIQVFRDGRPIVPVKPVLRRLASRMGVSLLNTNGNSRNTRQLGSELIKKLGG